VRREGASAVPAKRWLFTPIFRVGWEARSRLPVGVAADALRPIFAE